MIVLQLVLLICIFIIGAHYTADAINEDIASLCTNTPYWPVGIKGTGEQAGHLIRDIAQEITGVQGQGEKIWKLLAKHAILSKQNTAKDVKAVAASFPHRWKRSKIGGSSNKDTVASSSSDNKDNLKPLNPEWCKDGGATCNNNVKAPVQQVMASVRGAVLWGLDKVPKAGPVLSAVVGFLWPNYEDKSKSTWDEIKENVQKEIRINIGAALFNSAKNRMDDIRTQYINKYKFLNKSSDAAPGEWRSFYEMLSSDVCKTFVHGDDHELSLLPIFVHFANIQFLVLRDGIYNAKKYPKVWRWDDPTVRTDRKTQMQVVEDGLLQLMILYGSYVDSVYQHGLSSYPLEKYSADSRDCTRNQISWDNRNKYIRYMTLNVMDYRTSWLYMHPTIFPDPGVKVTLDRTIFSNPVGSAHVHLQVESPTRNDEYDHCRGYSFVQPKPSSDANRLAYLRGSGTDFVRSLQVGFSDGSVKKLNGSRDHGQQAFVLDRNVEYNPIYRVDYGASYLIGIFNFNYLTTTITRNRIQYITFKLANGTAISLNRANGGGTPVMFQEVQEVVLGSYNPPPTEKTKDWREITYRQDHVDHGNAKYEGHILSDVIFMGETPDINGVSVAVFSFRLEDSYPPSPYYPLSIH